MDKLYDSKMAISAQKRYCDENEVPYFAPVDGICFSCCRNIYVPYGASMGITVDEAGRRLITSCPHCNKSYVE